MIGDRPIDLHIKGFEALGAAHRVEQGNVKVFAGNLRGGVATLRGRFGPTVLGTDNVMMAAVLADGVTVIESSIANTAPVALTSAIKGFCEVNVGETPGIAEPCVSRAETMMLAPSPAPNDMVVTLVLMVPNVCGVPPVGGVVVGGAVESPPPPHATRITAALIDNPKRIARMRSPWMPERREDLIHLPALP